MFAYKEIVVSVAILVNRDVELEQNITKANT